MSIAALFRVLFFYEIAARCCVYTKNCAVHSYRAAEWKREDFLGRIRKKCFVIVALRRSLSMFDRWIEVSPRRCLGWLLKHRWPETKTEGIILHGYKKNFGKKDRTNLKSPRTCAWLWFDSEKMWITGQRFIMTKSFLFDQRSTIQYTKPTSN